MNPSTARSLIAFLSGVLVVLLGMWGVLLARQNSARKLPESTLKHLSNSASEKTGIDAPLIRAVIQVESGGRPDAVSSAGARGLMQLMPGTAADMLKEAGLAAGTDWSRPAVNVGLGALYLKKMHKQFDSDRAKALAAYNAGPGNVRKWIRRARAAGRPERWLEYGFGETKRYVPRIEKHYGAYREKWREDSKKKSK